MAISSTQSYVEYTGDSSTTSFTIPFYFLLNSDISVMIADAEGDITELTNGTDFTVTGQGVSTGGTCVLNTAYSNSYSILVYREPPETQETKYYENGKFPAKSHESALDKLTMLIQRFGWMWDSLALKRPNFFADYYDANGHRISHLQDPKAPQDAATKNYADGLYSSAIENADEDFKRTLRVPEAAISTLPSIAGRAGKLLAFNDAGQPITIHSQTDGGTQLEIDLAAQLGYSLIGQVASFADLRLLVPTYPGQRVLLASWNKDVTPYGQSSFGGDEFVAVSGSYADDGGFTAKVSDSWAWQRCRNTNEATVLHFGGVPGGDFDNHDAIMSMHLWSQGLGGAAAPGIIFPAGIFYTSPVDFTTASVPGNNHTFNLHGPEVTHGKHCQLTILSDKSSSPVFKIEAYDGDIAFFNFNGQATISGTTPSNVQPFLENIQSGPQNVHIRFWYLKNVGGLGFKLSDTLDTRFDETYCDGVYGGLYEIGYDNQVSGNWNHPTAVEWSNFNYQNVYPSPVFKSPRLRQAIIKNGWIEKSNPGDLTDSQIAMITFCIEDCYTDTSGNVSYLDLRNSNFTMITSDIQPQYMKTGYNVDTAWNTSYLPGQSLLEPHGIFTSHGTVASRMAAGPLLINTYSNTVETWYYVGKFWFQDIGSSLQIKVTGDAGAVWDTTAIYPWSTQHGGHSLINIQRKSDSSAQHVNWSNHGGPVTDVRFTGGGGNNLELWIKVGINAMCSLRADVSSPGDVVAQYNNTNLSATLWFGDVTKEDPPSDARTPMTSWLNRAGWQQDSSGNVRRGGLGIASDGRLVAGAATLDLISGESSSGVTRNLVLYIDGVPYAITATQITTS